MADVYQRLGQEVMLREDLQERTDMLLRILKAVQIGEVLPRQLDIDLAAKTWKINPVSEVSGGGSQEPSGTPPVIPSAA